MIGEPDDGSPRRTRARPLAGKPLRPPVPSQTHLAIVEPRTGIQSAKLPANTARLSARKPCGNAPKTRPDRSPAKPCPLVNRLSPIRPVARNRIAPKTSLRTPSRQDAPFGTPPGKNSPYGPPFEQDAPFRAPLDQDSPCGPPLKKDALSERPSAQAPLRMP